MAKIKTINLNTNGVIDKLTNVINAEEEKKKQVVEEKSNKRKEEKKKRNYMLTDQTVTQLLELQLYFVGAGRKKDLSQLVTEAVEDLHNKYIKK